MFSRIKCSIIGHKPIPAGACPYTGKTYEACARCGKMREV